MGALMRLAEYVHQIDVIIGAVPAEYRPSLLAWISARYNLETGRRMEVPEAIEIAVHCDDCPDIATIKCDTCPVLRAFDDTDVFPEE
jgi:hypothetical protein